VHRLGPESCSQQVAPRASPTWPCGEVMAELHLAGWCLSGCTALLSELLRGGPVLLDSALVTCSLKKKTAYVQKKKQHEPGPLTLEAKWQAHQAGSAFGQPGDAAEFQGRARGVFWRPPCTHSMCPKKKNSMSQAPLPSRQNSRLIRQGRQRGLPGCPATPLNFRAGPEVFYGDPLAHTV
jgi:hypothetical protein